MAEPVYAMTLSGYRAYVIGRVTAPTPYMRRMALTLRYMDGSEVPLPVGAVRPRHDPYVLGSADLLKRAGGRFDPFSSSQTALKNLPPRAFPESQP